MRYREFALLGEGLARVRSIPKIRPRPIQSAMIQQWLVAQLIRQSQLVRPTPQEISAAVAEFARLQKKADLDYYADVRNYRRKTPFRHDQ